MYLWTYAIRQHVDLNGEEIENEFGGRVARFTNPHETGDLSADDESQWRTARLRVVLAGGLTLEAGLTGPHADSTVWLEPIDEVA